MNYRIPVTTTLLVLGLACIPAFASGPANNSLTPSHTPSLTSTSPQTEVIVSRMRKVYFFKDLDKDHNGQLSRAEIPKDMVKLRLDFVRADYDENGQLSPEEYVLYSRGLAPQYTGVYHAYTYTYYTGRNNVERIDMNR